MKLLRSLRVSIFLAIRSVFRGNHGITILTISMMALIYVNLLFLPSLIGGLIVKVNSQLVETFTSNVILSSSKINATIPDRDAYLGQIRSNDDVLGATATYRIGTQISKGNISNVWSVDAIDPNSFKDVFTTPNNLIEGSNLDSNDTDSILLGVEIAGADKTTIQGYSMSLKNVHVGDTITVNLINGKQHDFMVKGIFSNDFLQSDQRAYITQAGAVKLLPLSSNHATSIYIKSKKDVDLTDLGDKLTSLAPDIKFQTSNDLSGPVREVTNTFGLINKILKLISLIVAAITVFIVTYVDLVNKRQQTGIERAIGIKPGAIIGNYLIKSLFYAVIGIVIGVLVYLFLAVPLVIKYPFQFPYGLVALKVNQTDMIQSAIILGFVCVISSLIPAYRSVRIKILDAIWGI
jgi:putative ABC transport system permease protein